MNCGELLSVGFSAAMTTALFGLLLVAFNWKKLFRAQRAWNFVKKYNVIAPTYGFSEMSEKYPPDKSVLEIQQAINENPACFNQILKMFQELGIEVSDKNGMQIVTLFQEHINNLGLLEKSSEKTSLF